MRKVPEAPLVLTRPASQSAAWIEALTALAVPVCSLPLIEVAPVPEALAPARLALQGSQVVFFTSPAAVQALWQGETLELPGHTLAACVGPGTAAALRAQGVLQVLSPAESAAQFDSEALWPLLEANRQWAGQRVLWLRGDGGRDWLIEQLRRLGAVLDVQTIYRRRPAKLATDQLTALMAQPALWLFSSSEALGHLASKLSALGLPPPEALFTHPRIEERAKALGWPCYEARVVAPRPSDVAQAYHAWQASRPSLQ